MKPSGDAEEEVVSLLLLHVLRGDGLQLLYGHALPAHGELAWERESPDRKHFLGENIYTSRYYKRTKIW